jgi:hypothetical protein
VSVREPPPASTTTAFIDCINRADSDGLGRLLAEDHVLYVFDEPPLVGRAANAEAWRGYLVSFPEYAIYPHRVVAAGNRVAVLGHTTGSHLGLPDDQEAALTLIWVAEISEGLVRSWRLMEDCVDNRRALGLESD